jgi:hypothetical protein
MNKKINSTLVCIANILCLLVLIFNVVEVKAEVFSGSLDDGQCSRLGVLGSQGLQGFTGSCMFRNVAFFPWSKSRLSFGVPSARVSFKTYNVPQGEFVRYSIDEQVTMNFVAYKPFELCNNGGTVKFQCELNIKGISMAVMSDDAFRNDRVLGSKILLPSIRNKVQPTRKQGYLSDEPSYVDNFSWDGTYEIEWFSLSGVVNIKDIKVISHQDLIYVKGVLEFRGDQGKITSEPFAAKYKVDGNALIPDSELVEINVPKLTFEKLHGNRMKLTNEKEDIFVRCIAGECLNNN